MSREENLIVRLFLRLLLGVLLFLTLFPFIFMVITSLKSNPQFYRNFWLPSLPFHFSNYSEAWTILQRYLFNSFWTSGLSLVLTLIFSVLASYAFAREEFPGRRILFASVVCLLLVPAVVTLVPTFVVVKNFPYFWTTEAEGNGLLNTYWALIFPYTSSGLALGIFVITNYMRTLPGALFECARLDGAGDGAVMLHILLPLSIPILGAVSIIHLLGTWNNFIWPLICITDPDHAVVTTGLLLFVSQVSAFNFNYRYGPLFAGYTVAALPLLVLFFCCTRSFMRGMTSGALKM